ncbi:helix-turn-helix domain-containing protein [Aerococcaceae bacterium NML130460]|nr:helix-turn-helix domain-containing protein [Aerococcaceae bacterium NML130460]
MEVDKQAVGMRIKSIRQKFGKTMEEFGHMIESPAVQPGIISRWEAGISLPNAERLKNIAKVGNITTEELLYGKQADSIELFIKSSIRAHLENHIRLLNEYGFETEPLTKNKEMFLNKIEHALYEYIPLDLLKKLSFESIDMYVHGIVESQTSAYFSALTLSVTQTKYALQKLLDFIQQNYEIAILGDNFNNIRKLEKAAKKLMVELNKIK